MNKLNLNQIATNGFAILFLDGGKRRRLTKTYYTESTTRSYNVAIEIDNDDRLIKSEFFKLEVRNRSIGRMTEVTRLPSTIKKQVDDDIKKLYNDTSYFKIL